MMVKRAVADGVVAIAVRQASEELVTVLLSAENTKPGEKKPGVDVSQRCCWEWGGGLGRGAWLGLGLGSG